MVAVILDRGVFLPDNPGWRHAAAPLGLPWALVSNTFGVMTLGKAQHQKVPAKENPVLLSLALFSVAHLRDLVVKGLVGIKRIGQNTAIQDAAG